MKGDFYCIPHFQQLLKSEGFHGEEFKPEQKSNGPLEGDGADPKAQVEESRGQLSRTTNVGETSQRDVILSPAHTSKLDLEPSGKSGSPRKLKITWPPPKEAQRIVDQIAMLIILNAYYQPRSMPLNWTKANPLRTTPRSLSERSTLLHPTTFL
ncbi:LIM domain and actin-binding protein 1-like [Callorhinchus milii]|uniref:LIM domain and actin-binding protein 1-like n=1 Tax=Callorhinchus milii TaxID=7868 RepID=UPI001C3FEAB2|nr:LIM domain and actin-binding protein 1-like [Callorhinchus milii]